MQIHALEPFSEAARGKFVLLRFRESVHFVASSTATRAYHARIVFDFVQGSGRGKAEMVSETQCKILSVGWKILGGGYYEIDPAESILRLSEKSTAYGKFSVEVIRRYAPDLLAAMPAPGFRLQII